MKGTRSDTRWKSSSVRSSSQARAMAIRCSTACKGRVFQHGTWFRAYNPSQHPPALVEPPVAMTSTIAFSKAARVMMSRGLTSRRSSSNTYLPATSKNNGISGRATEQRYRHTLTKKILPVLRTCLPAGTRPASAGLLRGCCCCRVAPCPAPQWH